MAEAKWYVVHTYSGYENKVKVDIENTIENRNLQDQLQTACFQIKQVQKHGFSKGSEDTDQIQQ